jgi:hypothetical protein
MESLIWVVTQEQVFAQPLLDNVFCMVEAVVAVQQAVFMVLV